MTPLSHTDAVEIGTANSKIQNASIFTEADNFDLGHGLQGQVIYIVNTSNGTITASYSVANGAEGSDQSFTIPSKEAICLIFIEAADPNATLKGTWYHVKQQPP